MHAFGRRPVVPIQEKHTRTRGEEGVFLAHSWAGKKKDRGDSVRRRRRKADDIEGTH